MLDRELSQKVGRFDEAAKREQLQSPQIVQKTKAVRFPTAAVTTLAMVTQTLRRADNSVTPAIEAITNYKIRTVGQSLPAAWSANTLYQAGDEASYSGNYYTCLLNDTIGEARGPGNTSFWVQSYGVDAWLWGYAGTNLLEVVPWMQVGDIVEVIYKPDYDDDLEPISGTEKWYIMETATRCEITVSDTIRSSVAWNENQNRVMAVYR